MFNTAWLIGEGRWGSRIRDSLDELGVRPKIIDIRHGTSIHDVKDLDPIIIATPTQLHYDHVKHFLLRGHDIFVEKPACEIPAQIKSLISMKRTNQIVMPGHIYMFNALMSKLTDIIRSGILGDIRFVHCERTNLGTYQTRNVLLNNIALHDFTIIDHIWGITSVDTARFTDISDDNIPDRATILGRAGRIDWQLDVSWLSAARRRSLTICGTDGQAVWDDDQRSITITKTNTRSGSLEYERLPTIKDDGMQPLSIELKHFLTCCYERKIPMVCLEDSLRISEIISSAEILGNVSSTNPNH